MGFLDDLFTGPAKVMCAVSGHDYTRARGYLVCSFCGHRVNVSSQR